MHIDLEQIQPGSYVVMRDIVPWGVTKVAMRNVGKQTQEIAESRSDEFIDVVFGKMIKEWSIKDEDGNLINKKPNEFTRAEIDDLDGRIVVQILNAATKVAQNLTIDPNSQSAS